MEEEEEEEEEEEGREGATNVVNGRNFLGVGESEMTEPFPAIPTKGRQCCCCCDKRWN